MKGLTVRQPWAALIAAGHKQVENRSRNTSHRGPLAIHAGRQLDWHARVNDPTAFAWLSDRGWCGVHRAAVDPGPLMGYGVVLATVALVDAHQATGTCCVPWGEQPDPQARPLWHWVLADAVPLPAPVACRGALGLWTLPDHIATQLHPVPTGKD